MHPEQPAAPYPATLNDVAKVAGVSLATASKAINGRGETIIRGNIKTCPVCKGTGVVPKPDKPPGKPN